MSASYWQPALFVVAGSISLTVGIDPAPAATSPRAASAVATDNERPKKAMRLAWTTPGADKARAAVEVVGADPAAIQALATAEMTPDRWTSFLSVRVVSAAESPALENPPLWGSYRVSGAVIRFEPRFPLEPGITYRATFDPVRLHAIARTLTQSGSRTIGEPQDPSRLTAEYSRPKKSANPTTQVAQIYPTSDLLPENLLRFYLAFTAPMSRGEAYQRIALVDAATGKRIDSPFLELDEELWSPDGMRFTLLFDPGRVKRGLRPREELGPVLKAGQSYVLAVDTDWPDAAGNRLATGFRKSFRVREPDLSSPDPKTWTIRSPRANSPDPLEVRFPEPLDRALLLRLISVHDADARLVAGEVSLGEAETLWRFTPVDPWQRGIIAW